MNSKQYTLTDADADFIHDLLVEEYQSCEFVLENEEYADEEEKRILMAHATRKHDVSSWSSMKRGRTGETLTLSG